jgi:hypothetical protein
MKRKAREHGHFPRVKRRPLGDELIARMKDFEKNAQLGALLTRRRMMDDGRLYDMQTQEAMAINAEERMPPLRAGMAAAVGAKRMRDEIASVPKKQDMPTPGTAMSDASTAVPGTPVPNTRKTKPKFPLQVFSDGDMIDRILERQGRLPPGTGLLG